MKMVMHKRVKQMRRPLSAAVILVAFLGLQACREAPGAKYTRYLQSGKQLMAKKDPSRAILQFRNAASLKPNDPEPFFQMAMAFLALGDYHQGVEALRKTLLLDPKHAGAQVQLSRLMVMTNDPALLADARVRLQSLLTSGQEDPDALQVLALSELKLGNPEEAVPHLESALATAPKNLQVAAMLAQAKLSENDTKGAEEVLKKAVASLPQSADAAIALGRLYMGLKRYPEAEEQFRRAISLDGKSGTALLSLAILQNGTGKKSEAEQTLRVLAGLPNPESKAVLGLFLFENGRQEEAVKEFESIVNAFPDNRPARTRLVAAYNAMNRGADAQRVLDSALKKNPKDSDALVQRAELLIAAGKFDLAENDLNQVLRLQSNSAEAHYVVARLYLARGSKDRYRQELQKALDINPYLEPVRRDLAQVLISINQAKAALDVIGQAPESQRGDIVLITQRNWANWTLGDLAAMRKGIDQGLAVKRSTELLIQDGVWRLRSGSPETARASLEEALKLDPSDIGALRVLKDTYGRKQLPAAIARIKELAAMQPKSAPVQEFLATLLIANGNRQEARAAMVAAKAADPQSQRADFLLVQVDALDGKWDDARTTLQGVLARHEDATARLWLGNVEELNGKHAAALEQYRKAVAADPNNPKALNNLAYLLLIEGKNKNEALKYAQQAVEMSPDDLSSKDTLGWVLYQAGSYSMAVKHLEAAAKGQDVIPKYHLAMAYAREGDMAKAHITLAAALKQNSKIAEARAAQEIVK
jgi:tetratricopeptide (TPR) repeat protein